MEHIQDYLNIKDWHLSLAMGLIVLSPLYWNVVGRYELRTKSFTNLFGSEYYACYCFGVTIFLLGLHRDFWFYELLQNQPQSKFLDQESFRLLGTALICVGVILVLVSTWKLGFTGTFLGDYFGILMEERVTSFPFNIFDNPMYVGSTMNFLGLALKCASPCGLLISGFVYIVYWIGLLFEEPYTDEIYRQKKH